MPKTKTPDLYSAAVTARVISRKLRKAGFLMADTSDKHHWTEGFTVSRVGYSKDVSVSYHLPSYGIGPGETQKCRDAYDRVRRFLRDQGYPLSEIGVYVKCERD